MFSSTVEWALDAVSVYREQGQPGACAGRLWSFLGRHPHPTSVAGQSVFYQCGYAAYLRTAKKRAEYCQEKKNYTFRLILSWKTQTKQQKLGITAREPKFQSFDHTGGKMKEGAVYSILCLTLESAELCLGETDFH